jgi:Mg-chelatase subunit ChlD
VTVADVPTLDFPYAVRSNQAHRVTAAANAFRNALSNPAYKTVFAQNRLRWPDGTSAPGFPTGHGVTANVVHVQPLSDMAKVKKVLSVWTAARTPSRIVAMVDATSSMAEQMGGGKSRMQVMREASVRGLALFTDDSELGLWAFMGAGQINMVPLARLGSKDVAGGQRAKLTAAISVAAPGPSDASPLYQSIINGYKEILNGYKPELSNTLVIFTDGRDTSGLDLGQVQRDLEVLADVTRPVRVILLGMGPDVDRAALEAIAKTTGGAAFPVTNAEDMEPIFLAALLT